MAARLRGHEQRKLNDHVYSFLLFLSSRPDYQAEFQFIESGLFHPLSVDLKIRLTKMNAFFFLKFLSDSTAKFSSKSLTVKFNSAVNRDSRVNASEPTLVIRSAF